MGLKRKNASSFQHKRLYGAIPEDSWNCDELRIQLMMMLHATDCAKYRFPIEYLCNCNPQNFVYFLEAIGASAGKRCSVYPLLVRFIEKNCDWTPGHTIIPLTNDEVHEINRLRYNKYNPSDEEDFNDDKDDGDTVTYWSSSTMTTRNSTQAATTYKISQGYRPKRFAHHSVVPTMMSKLTYSVPQARDLSGTYLPELLHQETIDTHWMRTCHHLRIPITDAHFLTNVIATLLPSFSTSSNIYIQTPLPSYSSTNIDTFSTSYPPIYHTCEEIRQSILMYLNCFPAMTPTRFARLIGSNVYAVKRFLHQATIMNTTTTSLSGMNVDMVGRESVVYPLAYIFFEKLRVACHIQKTPSRRQCEAQYPLGYLHGSPSNSRSEIGELINNNEPIGNDIPAHKISAVVEDPLDSIWKKSQKLVTKQSTVLASQQAITKVKEEEEQQQQRPNSATITVILDEIIDVSSTTTSSSLESFTPSPPPSPPTSPFPINLPPPASSVPDSVSIDDSSSMIVQPDDEQKIGHQQKEYEDVNDDWNFLPDHRLLSTACTEIEVTAGSRLVFPWTYDSNHNSTIRLPSCSSLSQQIQSHQHSLLQLPITTEPTRASFQRNTDPHFHDEENSTKNIQESMSLLGSLEGEDALRM